MNKEEVIQFANKNPVCFLATVQDDQPHVRTMMLWYADESGLYFETMTPKDISSQLHNNPNVEVCFYNAPKDLIDAKELRIRGKVEFINDEQVIQKAYESRKFLEGLAGQPLRHVVEVFRLAHGDAHFWEIKTDILKEPQLEHLQF